MSTRTNALRYLRNLDAALNDAIVALEIARDTAPTAADKALAIECLPGVERAESLVKNKRIALAGDSEASGIAPPDQAIVDETARLAKALAKVDANTAQAQAIVAIAGKLVTFATSV